MPTPQKGAFNAVMFIIYGQKWIRYRLALTLSRILKAFEVISYQEFDKILDLINQFQHFLLHQVWQKTGETLLRAELEKDASLLGGNGQLEGVLQFLPRVVLLK